MARIVNRTATPSRIVVEDVTLHLTRHEALLLWHLLRRTGPSPNLPRDEQNAFNLVRELRNVLEKAFEGDTRYTDLNSTEVIGGRTALRSVAMENLEGQPGWYGIETSGKYQTINVSTK
jgi:hypothetical protein